MTRPSPRCSRVRAHSPTRTKRVGLVGHNPGLGELATALTGSGAEPERHRLAAKYPTGAVAVLDFWTSALGAGRSQFGNAGALPHAGGTRGRRGLTLAKEAEALSAPRQPHRPSHCPNERGRQIGPRSARIFPCQGSAISSSRPSSSPVRSATIFPALPYASGRGAIARRQDGIPDGARQQSDCGSASAGAGRLRRGAYQAGPARTAAGRRSAAIRL